MDNLDNSEARKTGSSSEKGTRSIQSNEVRNEFKVALGAELWARSNCFWTEYPENHSNETFQWTVPVKH